MSKSRGKEMPVIDRPDDEIRRYVIEWILASHTNNYIPILIRLYVCRSGPHVAAERLRQEIGINRLGCAGPGIPTVSCNSKNVEVSREGDGKPFMIIEYKEVVAYCIGSRETQLALF